MNRAYDPFTKAFEAALLLTDDEMIERTAERLDAIPTDRLVRVVNSYMED